MPELISVAEARHRVLTEVRQLEAEALALPEALGRVLAEPVEATVDVPPFDPSAMDGFAVPPGAEGSLTIAGESRAGDPLIGPLAPGTAARISTGAPVPPGTGAVVPVEQADDNGGTVVVPALGDGANIRRAGEDMSRGDAVLTEGTVLGPPELGVLAALGHSSVRCAERPLLRILATGDELVAPGAPLARGQIWSSNPALLAAAAELAGARVDVTERVGDSAEETRSALGKALIGADVVCVSGGVSVGRHDHVKGALAALGVAERFWGVALKPGKPTWFGVAEVPGSRPALVFGLPGNPVSAAVTFELFARPALVALQGADPEPRRVDARLARPHRLGRRPEAVRVRISYGEGLPRAEPTGSQESHRLSSLLGADGLALLPAGDSELAADTPVTVELFGRR